MLLLKNKLEKVQEPAKGSAMHNAAQFIARVILDWQGKVAYRLNSRFRSLSHCTQQGCLFLFCLLFGGCSLCLLLYALRPGHTGIPPTAQVTLPQSIVKSLIKEANIPLVHT